MIKIIKATNDNLDLAINIRIEMLKVVNGLSEDTSFDEDFINCTKKYFECSSQTTLLAMEPEVIGCATICYINVMQPLTIQMGKELI